MIYLLFLLFSTSLFAVNNSTFYGDVGIGFEVFHSIPDGDWEGNNGAFASCNFASQIPYINCNDYGIQLGASFGVYDFNGRLSCRSEKQSAAQQQAFVTAGLFSQSACGTGFNFGVVYDWMWNKNFSVFALNPNLDQIRFQAGYIACRQDEVGAWGAVNLGSSHCKFEQIPVAFRAVNQINGFWRHRFKNCSETMIWAGTTFGNTLQSSKGKPGKYIIGGSFRAPLTDQLDVEGYGSYMQPNCSHNKQRNGHYNVCIELKWSLCGSNLCFKPYLPLANNSNFIVDSSLND